jgi:hypothetical protein
MKKFTWGEIRDRVGPICKDPGLKKWGKKVNMKGIDWYGIRKDFDRWSNSVDKLYEDVMVAFKLQLYLGDYLPATSAIFKATPTLMLLYKEMTGLKTFFESCDEATAFTVSNFNVMELFINRVVMPVYASFSESRSAFLLF